MSPKKPAKSNRRIGLVVDAENCSATLWPRVERALSRVGAIVEVHAVACTTVGRWADQAKAKPFILGAESQGPNAADFALSCLAGRIAGSGRVDDVAILSGDNGFAALFRALDMLGCGTIAVVPVRGGKVAARLVAAAPLSLTIDDSEVQEAGPDQQRHPQRSQLESAVTQVAAELSAPGQEWVPIARLATELAKRGLTGMRGKLAATCRRSDGLEVLEDAEVLAVRPKPSAEIHVLQIGRMVA